ncbi:MAG: hypothetical protein JNM41_10085 [Flavipsychrobacter sp.]|nr:hypothetical protein [Flavipsychrobacter sp.]
MLRRFVVGITLLFSAWFLAFYGKESYPFNGDAMGYYMYLPSTFIYHNLKALDWLPEDHKFDYFTFLFTFIYIFDIIFYLKQRFYHENTIQ